MKEIIEQLKIEEKDIKELSMELVESFRIAEKEAIDALNKLKSLEDINEIYSFIIDIKGNYLKWKKSDFSIIYKYCYSIETSSIPANKLKQCSKKALVFYTLFRVKFGFDLNQFKDQFITEALSYQKYNLLYSNINNFIYNLNSTSSIKFKLPTIENFEIEIFNRLKAENDKLNNFVKDAEDITKKHTDSIKEIYNKEIKYYKDQREGIKIELANSENKLTESEKNLNEYKSNYYLEKSKRESYEKEYNKQYEYNLKREPVYIIQFDQTVWGDNYPALKVLYAFLFKYYEIKFNWSFFGYVMTTENKDFININTMTGGISKSKTGFLLYKIKEFFTTDIHRNYYYWLNKKIYINNKQIDKNFYSNYIHGRTMDFSNLSNIDVIESLHNNIKKAYN